MQFDWNGNRATVIGCWSLQSNAQKPDMYFDLPIALTTADQAAVAEP